MVFWNVAKLRNKDGEVWNGLRDWDVVTLTETWIEEKEWSRIKERLPRGIYKRQKGRIRREERWKE